MRAVHERFWFGPAGWAYPDWKGRVYPLARPEGFHPLRYLADYVNLMELNTSFYAPVSAANAEHWMALLVKHPDFRFVVKGWQRFTHDATGLPSKAEMDQWIAGVMPIEAAGRLLAVLLQFPITVLDSPWVRQRLTALRAALPASWTIAVEVRHNHWLRPESLAFLEKGGFAFVNIDQPQGRGTLPPTALRTHELGYVRLHGRNVAAWFDPGSGRDARYDWHYSQRELQEWVGPLRSLAADGAPTVLVGNNHFHGKAVAAVLSLVHALAPAAVLRVPEPMLSHFAELRALQTPSQRGLFDV
ncbi:MAG: DUF72 domain-containing protein [Planctomycetes bacterium]|nr:DUF72 domain-containing protein [Planctomycetota bacterium]